MKCPRCGSEIESIICSCGFNIVEDSVVFPCILSLHLIDDMSNHILQAQRNDEQFRVESELLDSINLESNNSAIFSADGIKVTTPLIGEKKEKSIK